MAPRKYGEGSLYQRSVDWRWIGSVEGGYTTKGKRRRPTVSGPGCEGGCPPKCPHRAAIKRKLRDKQAAIIKAEGQVASGTLLRKTVKGWADEWLPIRRDSVRPSTYNTDATMVSWILPVIGGKRLVDLTPRDVRAVHARMRAGDSGRKGVVEASVARYHRALVKMLRDAVHDGCVVPDNVFTTPAPVEGENDREALETVQALAVMHHATDLPHGARYFVAFYQGLRQGEALGLTWDAIDFATNMITVEWQLQALPYKHGCAPDDAPPTCDRKKAAACPAREFRVPRNYVTRHLTGRFHLVRPKSRKGNRVIPMVPEIRQTLLALRADAGETVGNLVWTRPNGWPIDKADDAEEFRALQKAAGVKHPTGRPYFGHEIRNTTAQLLLEAGVDPVTITAILGHSSWATSAGYMKARQGQLQAAMEQIAAALKPKALGQPG